MDYKNESFFQGLFDFSFKKYVTGKLIKVLYILALVGAGFSYLVMVITGFSIGIGAGIVALLIAGPLNVIFIILFSRVSLEILMVVFSIYEKLNEINNGVEALRKTK